MSFTSRRSKFDKDEGHPSQSMVNHDVEKKCSLIARFYAENLDGYADKVRDNLSMYLNTVEKIRLRVTKNSVTVTDRTIWHNKLDRIPVSLIKECKVDIVSPKICYFVNETVLHRYQIMAVLCKSVDDSHRLVSSLQYRLLSSSHYKSHSNWLSNGSFEPKVDNPEKSRTLAGDERDKSSRRSSFRLRKKGASLPTNGIVLHQTSANSSILMTTYNNTHLSRGDDGSRQVVDHNQDQLTVTVESPPSNLLPLSIRRESSQINRQNQSEQVILPLHQRKSSSIIQSHVALTSPPMPNHSTTPIKSTQGEMKPPSEALTLTSASEAQTTIPHPATPLICTPIPSPTLVARHSAAAVTTAAPSSNPSLSGTDLPTSTSADLPPSATTHLQLKDADFRPMPSSVPDAKQEEGSVVMRKKSGHMYDRLRETRRQSAQIMRSGIKSSIIQFASDDEDSDADNWSKVYHNKEGVASLDVGGNTVIETSQKESPTTETNSASQGQKPASLEENSTSQKQKSTPQEQKSTPQKQKSTLQEQKSTLQEQKSTPQEQKSIPQEQKSTPQEEKPTPQKQKSTPQEQKPTPQKQKSTPQEQKSTPQEQKSTPQEQQPTLSEQKLATQKQKSTTQELRSSTKSSPTSEAKPLDNLLDGVYDNIRLVNEKMADNIKDKEAHPVLLANSSDEDDDDYEIVLAGLTHLTKSADGLKSLGKEMRYPHQVAAALSAKKCRQEKSSSRQQPTIGVHTGSSYNQTPRKVSNDMESMRGKPSRPPSIISGVQIVRNNEARRSMRRKGQYQSIAEYEKIKSAKNSPQHTPITVTAVTRISNPDNPAMSSVYSSMPIISDMGKMTPNRTRNNPELASRCMYTSMGSITSRQPNLDNQPKRSTSFLSANYDDQLSGTLVNRSKETLTGENNYLRRSSMISLSSAPSNVIHVRRKSTENVNPIKCHLEQEGATFDRLSRSFDRKCGKSRLHDSRSNVGSLQVVGSSNNMILSQSSGALRQPVIDGRLKHKAEEFRARPVSIQTQFCWAPPVQIQKKATPKRCFVPLPDAPDLRYTKRSFQFQSVSEQVRNDSWDNNPGFKRFFESIMTYGPNGTQTSIKKLSPVTNQPDIVLESLPPNQAAREDDSDEASSIRSSASAYWPPELKVQTVNQSEEFEEAASWKFHSPLVGVKQNQPVKAI